MKPFYLLLTLACAAPAARAAETADSALARCRSLPEAAARLACYDAVPLAAAPTVPPSATAAAAPQAAVQPAAPVVVAAPAVAVAPAVGAVVAPAAGVPAAGVALTPEAAFGLESRRSAVQDIRSSLIGVFEGWDRDTRFTLANGQVWQISDGTSASYFLRNPKVTVRRAALGSFRLEIEGVNQAPRVQRVE
jgi:hypothetical protein